MDCDGPHIRLHRPVRLSDGPNDAYLDPRGDRHADDAIRLRSPMSPKPEAARPTVELLWFADCPNHPAARALLRDVLAELAPGTPIVEIDATAPAVAARHRFPGSPTIRINGRDVDPSFRDPGDYTPRCRLYQTPEGLRRIPERAWIEAAVGGHRTDAT